MKQPAKLLRRGLAARRHAGLRGLEELERRESPTGIFSQDAWSPARIPLVGGRGTFAAPGEAPGTLYRPEQPAAPAGPSPAVFRGPVTAGRAGEPGRSSGKAAAPGGAAGRWVDALVAPLRRDALSGNDPLQEPLAAAGAARAPAHRTPADPGAARAAGAGEFTAPPNTAPLTPEGHPAGAGGLNLEQTSARAGEEHWLEMGLFPAGRGHRPPLPAAART